MKIELVMPFAPNSAVDEFDVRQLKKILNCLGYYQPYEKTGITGIPDAAIFEALKSFQKDYGLPTTGVTKPGDETLEFLNQKSKNEPDGFYIWRTVEDNKVRAAHAQYNKTVRAWHDSPDPGDDYNCCCWVEPLPNSAEDRKKALLGKGQADFRLKPDLQPVSDKPWHALEMMSEVSDNHLIIEEEAKAAGINPDFVRAIIYVETTQGYYDRINPGNKSIRPMNIQSAYWKELGYSREELMTPRLNIRAGIDLIKRIHSHAPHASASEIATLYNDLNAKRVNDYGSRVAHVMKEKPWLTKK